MKYIKIAQIGQISYSYKSQRSALCNEKFGNFQECLLFSSKAIMQNNLKLSEEAFSNEFHAKLP